MQSEILEKHPSAKVRVYVVWFSMIPTDMRSAWGLTSRTISDARVEHYWDDSKAVGRWYASVENPTKENPGVVWDAYYLYGPEARWTTKPEPLVTSGGTVFGEFEELRKKLVPLLH